MPWNGSIVLTVLWGLAAIQTQAEVCPSPSVVSNFNINKYLGTWYEIESIPNAMEIGGRCVRFTYTKPITSELSVELNMERPRTGKVTYHGLLVPEILLNTDAKFVLNYLTPDDVNIERYWILATDYTSYSIAWSCKTFQVSAIPMALHKAWILGRQKTMDNVTYSKVEEILQKLTDVFPRYALKETIPCSGAGMATVSYYYLILLLSVVIGGKFTLT